MRKTVVAFITIFLCFCIFITSCQPQTSQQQESTSTVCKISYILNGGVAPDDAFMPQSCQKGESITPTEPLKVTTQESLDDGLGLIKVSTTSYTFKGWKVSGSPDSTAHKSYTAAAEDVTLVAVWESKTDEEIYGKSTLSVGDTVRLGEIPKSDTTYGGYDIWWLVIDVVDTQHRALVISEKVLTRMRHQSIDSTYNWALSYINSWLNSTFINDYGLSNVSMANVIHETESYTTYGSSSVLGSPSYSNEKVFLLSRAEASAYLSSNTRVGKLFDGTISNWWLRSPYYSYRSWASYITESIITATNASETYGVRPAFWINLIP